LYWGVLSKLGPSFGGFKSFTYQQLCDAISSGSAMMLNVHGGAHWVLATSKFCFLFGLILNFLILNFIMKRLCK